MGLFTPVWKKDDLSKAIAAVRKMDNPQKLSKVAREAPNMHVRRLAIDMLSGQPMVEEIIAAISDPEELATIVCDTRNNDVQQLALAQLQDQQLLTRTLLLLRNSELKKAAFEKITDESCLVEIFAATEDMTMAAMAAKKVKDKERLHRVIVDTEDIEKRIALYGVAFSREQAALLEQIFNGRNPNAVRAIIPHLQQDKRLRELFWRRVESMCRHSDEMVKANPTDCAHLDKGISFGNSAFTFPPYPGE